MYARICFLVPFENLVFFVPFLDTVGTSNPGLPYWRRGVSQNYRKTSQNRRHQGNALPGPQKRQKMLIFQVRISEGIRVSCFLCTLCLFFIFSAFVVLPKGNSPGLRSRTSDISQKYRKISEILRFQGIALAGPQKRSKMLIFQVRISEGIRNVGTKKLEKFPRTATPSVSFRGP